MVIFMYVPTIQMYTHMERSSSHDVASFLLLFRPPHSLQLFPKLPKLRLVFAAQKDSGADLDQLHDSSIVIWLHFRYFCAIIFALCIYNLNDI